MTDQYKFSDGHFIDSWNEGINDETPLEVIDLKWHEAALEMCGCMDIEIIAEGLSEYLQRVEEGFGGRQSSGNHQIRRGSSYYLVDLLLASLADDKKLTEHGGNIGGSWLTDAGKRWLELWSSADGPWNG